MPKPPTWLLKRNRASKIASELSFNTVGYASKFHEIPEAEKKAQALTRALETVLLKGTGEELQAINDRLLQI